MSGSVRVSLVAVALSVTFVEVCAAQGTAPELITDRPDFTESSEVVGSGVVQIESGLTFEQTDEIAKQVTAPQLLVRVGIGPRFELRFAGDGFVSQSVETPGGVERSGGHSDAEIGAKFKLFDAAMVGFDMAVIPFLSLPTASDGFGTNGYDPGFKLTVARELVRGFGLSGNFNAASVTSQAGRAWEREASVSLGHGLGGAWGAYWETYGSFHDGDCDCTVNTGVTRALGVNGQVDVEVGRGVSGQAQDWFVGVGFAVRRLHR
jgi:hypothetical protein